MKAWFRKVIQKIREEKKLGGEACTAQHEDEDDDDDDDEDDDGDDDDDNDSCLHQTACRVIAPKSQRAQPTEETSKGNLTLKEQLKEHLRKDSGKS